MSKSTITTGYFNHTETNRNGCRIVREFYLHRERYHYDAALKGWKQYDTPQDASYFGVWTDRDSLQTLTFAEGDVTRVTAPNQAAFDAELADMDNFYKGDA
jgi:hypothetical protein